MITARQSRAARALLGWTQETLADKAQVALTALKRLESQSGLEVFESTRDQVRRALEAAGIVFCRRIRARACCCNTIRSTPTNGETAASVMSGSRQKEWLSSAEDG